MDSIKKSKVEGFTLVELLVGVMIFSLIGGIAAGVFTMGLGAQRKSLATQEILSQTSYLMEYISRALRMARKELNCLDPADPATCDPANPPQCLTGAGYGYGYNYETNPARDRIRFLNYQYLCQEFFLDGTQIKERKSTDHTEANFGPASNLTSADLSVDSFNIGPGDSWDQNDDDQPRVTFFLEIQGFKIQTTVSQRNPDIPK